MWSSNHITKDLINKPINFKIILLVYKALNGLAPSYLLDCLPKYVPSRPLRSSTAGLLAVPKKMATKRHGEAAFCFYGPTAWNKLPLYLRQAASVDIFKAQLKTYLYTIAFNWSFKFFMSSLYCITATILMFFYFAVLLFSVFYVKHFELHVMSWKVLYK